MAITIIEYKKKRSGTRYNPDKKCYVGYRIDVWINNVRYRNKRFPTRKEAETYIDNLKLKNTYAKNGLSVPREREIPRVSEVFEQRLRLIKNKAEKVRAVRVFALFQSVIKYDLRITEIKQAHFQLFINERLADGVKKETANRDINTLAPAFNLAPEMFPETLADYQPIRIPRPKVNRRRGRTRVITEAEKNLICSFLRAPQTEKETDKVFQNRIRIARMFELAWLLGLRFGEVAKLQKKDFDFKQKTLKVRRWKTDGFTFIEYLPDFICHQIKKAIEESETNFIYTISGNYPKNFYKILQTAVESVGLTYGREDKDGITFHSNRHSFTTRLIQSTDLATAQHFTGLSTKELLGYYGHATDESKKSAMENLYGKPNDFSLQFLREIFDNVRGEKMDFAEFCEKMSGVKIEVIDTNQTQKLRLVK